MMKENEVIVKRQSINTRFKNEDMDFMFNWAVGVSEILGMSPSQVFLAIHNVKDEDPDSWRAGFCHQADYQVQRAKESVQTSQPLSAGQFLWGQRMHTEPHYNTRILQRMNLKNFSN